MVLELVYSSLEEAIKNRISIRLGNIGRYLSPLITWQIEPRLGFNPNLLAPIKHMSKIRIPILIIAGTEDKHTTLEESKRMYDSASGPKIFWAVKGAEHQDIQRYTPKEYSKTILKFFAKYL